MQGRPNSWGWGVGWGWGYVCSVAPADAYVHKVLKLSLSRRILPLKYSKMNYLVIKLLASFLVYPLKDYFIKSVWRQRILLEIMIRYTSIMGTVADP